MGRIRSLSRVPESSEEVANMFYVFTNTLILFAGSPRPDNSNRKAMEVALNFSVNTLLNAWSSSSAAFGSQLSEWLIHIVTSTGSVPEKTKCDAKVLLKFLKTQQNFLEASVWGKLVLI